MTRTEIITALEESQESLKNALEFLPSALADEVKSAYNKNQTILADLRDDQNAEDDSFADEQAARERLENSDGFEGDRFEQP